MISSLLALFILTVPAPWAVTLEWDASPDAESGWVTGYKIYEGPSSGNYTKSYDVGNALQFVVESMKVGQPYFFAATAYADGGTVESDFSNEVSFTPPDYHPRMRIVGNEIVFPTPPGLSWMVEQTQDFKTWALFSVATESNGEIRLPVNLAEHPYMFFRARLVPPADPTTMLRTIMAASVIKLPPIPAMFEPKRVFKRADERKGATLLMDMLKKSRVKEEVQLMPPMPGVK
jgi:hypothetical protein